MGTFCCSHLSYIHESKLWINKNETLLKIEDSVTSTILIKTNWFFSNLKYLWDGYFDKVSYGLIRNYGCYIIFNFCECLIFWFRLYKLYISSRCYKVWNISNLFFKEKLRTIKNRSAQITLRAMQVDVCQQLYGMIRIMAWNFVSF